MKKLFVTLLAIIAFVAVNAQNTTTLTTTDNANAPVITFDKKIHDFGKIQLNGKALVEFKFTNTGKMPLIISGCRASCGCTTPDCPVNPIDPGKTGIIKVEYTTTSRPGGFTKNVTITSNASNATEILTIKGEVVAPATDNVLEKNTSNLTPTNK